MSFSSMPQPKGLLVTYSQLQNLYNSLNTSNVTNNTNTSPQDAGFVGFTGVRANANSFQVIDSRGNSAFITGQQAANLGIANAGGLDFSGVQRFLPQNISFNVPSAPQASGTPTPGSTTTVPNNTQNPSPSSGRSITDTVNGGLAQIKKFFQGPGGGIALVAVGGLALFLAVKK